MAVDMSQVKDWTSLSEIHPEFKATIDAAGGKTPDLGVFGSIQDLRNWFIEAKKAATAAGGPEIPGITKTDHQVSMRDGDTITCRVYVHESTKGGPLAVLFHGGGWCIGGLENEDLICCRLAGELGMVVVNVDYRLAPEHKFPIPIYDAHDATKWAAANASTLGADPSKGFIIAGVSAGGQLATIVSLLARDEKMSPPLTGCLLYVPASFVYKTVVPEKYRADFRSMEQNKDAPILTGSAIDLFMDNYIPDQKDRESEINNPLLWSKGHSGLPPHHFQVCGMDALRDEALIYERLLREDEGTPTKLRVYQGVPHSFWTVYPKMELGRQFLDDTIDGARWLLQQR